MKKLLVTLALAVAGLSFRAPTPSVAAESGPPLTNEVVERFLRSAAPPLVSYRARRTLTASALGGRVSGSLVADTSLDPDGTFRFEIVREEGSALVRNRVLKAALLAEQRSHAGHEIEDIALTPTNYEFQIGSEPVPGFFRLTLIAKRRSPMLLNGAATLSAADADLLRIEGSPAESPSFWTRQVNVVCDYARIDGVRVTVGIRSRADVRLVGDSAFAMTYEYTAINDRPTTGTLQGSRHALSSAPGAP
jgi:hypothetical protein